MNQFLDKELPLEDLETFVKEFLRNFPKGGVFGLTGELGSGKTTFVRSIIKAISEQNKTKVDRVISPSFVFHQSYEFLKPPIHHFDLYRMDQVTEAMLVELEYFEIVETVKKKQGYLFVEWPELCTDTSILGLDGQIAINILDNSRRYQVFVKSNPAK